MSIEKPFAVYPEALTVSGTGSELSNRPAVHLSKFKDAGMRWETSGAGSIWARGTFGGSAKEINFMSLLGTNATVSTRVRLRLGASQTDVDSATGKAVVTSATYTSSGQLGGYGAALNSNGAGLRDGDLGVSTATSTFSDSSTAGHWVQIDLGSSQSLSEVSIAGSQFATYLNGGVIEGATTLGTWTTIQTLGTVTIGTLYTCPINTSYRYVRIRMPNAAFLRVSEFYVRTSGFSYDSGLQTIRNPAITREDNFYHSFLQMPSVIADSWWRIDCDAHTGNFSAMALVLGKQLQFSNYYTPENTNFGQEDYGELTFDRFGVADELPGNKMRLLDMDFGWMTDADRFDKFQPLRDKIGTTSMCYWCFDPDATVQRQDKCYFGPLTKPAFFRPSVFNMSRWQSQFQIRSII